jgi:hypothetical protein
LYLLRPEQEVSAKSWHRLSSYDIFKLHGKKDLRISSDGIRRCRTPRSIHLTRLKIGQLDSPDIDPYRSCLIYGPPGNPCSPVVSASISRLDVTLGFLTGVTNQVLQGGNNYAVYEDIANPSNIVSIPLWYNAQDGWTSGITIQTIQEWYTSIQIKYYYANGQTYAISPSYDLAPHEIKTFTDTTGGLRGSVEITAAYPVAVVSNMIRSASDGLMSFSGVHK